MTNIVLGPAHPHDEQDRRQEQTGQQKPENATVQYNERSVNKSFPEGQEARGIYALLYRHKEHGLTLSQISNKLKLQEQLCYTILRGAIKRGEIRQDEYGAYYIVELVT